MVSVSKRKVKTQGLKPGDSRKHSYDKCCFPLYFILTARNTILSGGYLLPHYISVSMVACEQALLGVGGGGGGGGKRIHPQESLLAGYLYLGELAMLEVITVKRL